MATIAATPTIIAAIKRNNRARLDRESRQAILNSHKNEFMLFAITVIHQFELLITNLRAGNHFLI